jgi:hypothetical protein
LIRLWADPPGLEQEQPESLQAGLICPLVLMEQRTPLVWEEWAAWEEQVSLA